MDMLFEFVQQLPCFQSLHQAVPMHQRQMLVQVLTEKGRGRRRAIEMMNETSGDSLRDEIESKLQ